MSKSKTFACDQHASNILSKLHTFYRDQLFFDIALTTKTDNLKVHAHRAVLSASSDYFLAMLCSTLKEARSDVIELEIDGATLKAVVDFMYSGTIQLSFENVARILVAADVLKMTTLKVVCSEFIGETIDTTNCLRIASLSKQQKSAELHQKAFEFALLNFEEVCKNKEFLQLTEEQLSELISSDDLCVNSEETVFHSVVSWVKHDKGLRGEYMTGLLTHVRFSFLTPEFIVDNRQSVSNTYECLLCSWLESHLSRTKLTKRHSERKKANGPEIETLGFVSGQTTHHLKMQYFEPESNVWTSEDLPPSPTQRSSYNAMVMDKKLIVAGGFLSGAASNIVECLDLHTKEWTNLPPMREPRTTPGMAALNGDLYVFGGETGNSWSKPSMEKYDFRTGEWQKLPPMPLTPSQVNVTVFGELLYAVGVDSSNIECFNPADSKWTQLPHRNGRSSRFGIAGVGGYLYAVGGIYNKQYSKTVERFNPLTNTWTVISPGLALGLTSLKCISWNNRLIACGGYINPSTFHNSVVEYNPDENDWMKLGSLGHHHPDSLFTITK